MTRGKNSSESAQPELTYIQKVWQTVAIIALLVIVILIARVAFNVLLMVLAGALFSIYFNGLAGIIHRKTRINAKWALFISIAGSFAVLGVLLWFMGTTIETQISQLSKTLPHTVSVAKVKLAETPVGQQILEYFSGDNSKQLMSTAQQFFSTSFGVLGNIYVILLLSIFFTINPALYTNGIIILFPDRHKEDASRIINRICVSLTAWLKTTILSIVLITVILTIGLTIIGIPAALVLALFAGMLKIIPNFGSLIAMIPGVLLALTIGTNTAIIVTLLYIISQTVVSSIVTPLVQKKMINLPPALTIISQVIMGTLSGGLGIILSVPLLAILFILIEELYINKMGKEDDKKAVAAN